jgi:hypothetical protein
MSHGMVAREGTELTSICLLVLFPPPLCTAGFAPGISAHPMITSKTPARANLDREHRGSMVALLSVRVSVVPRFSSTSASSFPVLYLRSKWEVV